MPSLGSGLSLGTLNKISGFDYDASSYITLAGITDATARIQINDFILGLKAINLWDVSVCWPLRSTQNIGSGTIAYSFGGFGSYHGTLSSNPTWTTSGVTFTGASGGTLNNSSIPAVLRGISGYACILVGLNVATGTINFGVLKGGGGNQIGDNYVAVSRQYNFIAQAQNYLTGGTGERTFGSTSFALTGFNFLGASRTGLTAPSTNTGFVKANATTNSTRSGTGNLPSTNPYAEEYYITSSLTPSNIYAFCMASSAISENMMEDVRTLYKATLGTGLNLP
jgi:hypothetical protein